MPAAHESAVTVSLGYPIAVSLGKDTRRIHAVPEIAVSLGMTKVWRLDQKTLWIQIKNRDQERNRVIDVKTPAADVSIHPAR